VELPLRGWRDLSALLRALTAAKPDRLQFEYSNYGWSRWGCAGWLNALALRLRLCGVPLHVALHEFCISARQHPRLAPVAMLQRLHFWLLAAAAAEVSTNTLERVRILRRWLPWKRARIHYRPNGSNIPVKPLSAGGRRAVRAAAGADENDLVVALFGTYQAGKNLEAVVDAIRLLEGGLPLRLWFIGDPGPARPAYVAALREEAARLAGGGHWTGALPADQVSAHLQAADIFILPQPDGHLTRSGSFMAAAAHGLPVIAVRDAENQREFAHGGNVYLAERSTPEEFARALAALAANPAQRRRMGVALQQLYLQRFDWPVLIAGGASESPRRIAAALPGTVAVTE
jgi:glycosyltransferase involved in cell wall biosynthesis